MYAVLHHTKVLLGGKEINMYDAFKLTDKQDGNRKLVIKQGVTDLDGNAIDNDFIDKLRNRIKYVNQTTHGAMNQEDKGIISQYILGRAVMNFRQWMIEHYSRRYRKRHWDYTLKEEREGFYRSVYEWLKHDTEEMRENKQYWKVVGTIIKDVMYFFIRSSSHMHNMDEM